MTLAERDGWIWFDGAMVPWREAQVHVLTHSLHYGMGVFEGVRAYPTATGPAIFRLRDHTERLFRSAHILAMPLPFDRATINAATVAVVRDNGLDDAYIRPLVFYGAEGLGLRADNLRTHVAIAAWPWGTYLGDGALERGIRVGTSSLTRHHVNVSMCRTKTTGHYVNSMLALAEAQRNGYDEALLLDAQGYVAEGSGENLFLVIDGALHTPLTTSALDGITRRSVLTLAAELGLAVHERPLTRDEVYVADEAFFTGTAAEVTPVRELDGRTIGSGSRGPVTARLQQHYFDLVHGRLESHRDWLTPVRDEAAARVAV